MRDFENQSLADMIVEDKRLLCQILGKIKGRLFGCAIIVLEFGAFLAIQVAMRINN